LSIDSFNRIETHSFRPPPFVLVLMLDFEVACHIKLGTVLIVRRFVSLAPSTELLTEILHWHGEASRNFEL